MSVLPTTAHEIARSVGLGEVCSQCTEPFVRYHGYPVACRFCWEKLTPDERKGLTLATHDEATANHFKTEARKRRARKESQNT